MMKCRDGFKGKSFDLGKLYISFWNDWNVNISDHQISKNDFISYQ